jgi:hypothetical protein
MPLVIYELLIAFVYLQQGKSDLLSLAQVLICTFQELPPVYEVPTQPTPAPTPVNNSNVPYPTQNYGTPYPVMPNMPMPGVTSPQPVANEPLPFSMRPSLISAAEEKLKRRLEDIYFSTEIEKKVN